MGRYTEAFSRAVDDREGFWLEAAEAVDWTTEPTRALDDSAAPFYRWFPGGELNTSYNALDRHVAAGHGDRTALIWDSAMVGEVRRYTYAELLDEVSRFAGVLAAPRHHRRRSRGHLHADDPGAAIAMLACSRIGAVHSVVFGGFAAPELAARIDDAEPDAIVTASGGLEPGRAVEYLPMVARAIELSASAPQTVIVKNRPPEINGSAADHDGWLDWDEAIAGASPAEPVPVAATDPLYILYTSGTTGKPKGVVRDNGGHAVALAWSMKNLYDISAGGDVWWTASDVGWVVGHSYIVYAPLLVGGATTVMYEGKPVGTPGRRRVLACHRRSRREGAVHRADRDPRRAQGRSERGRTREVRHLHPADAVRRR